MIMAEDYKLKHFEKEMLRKIFGPKQEEATGGCNDILRTFMICTVRHI
jgi:hypothetical protein